MLVLLLSVLTLASWVYWLVALWLVRTHFQARQELNPDFVPPVSILKPVKGLDDQAYENFASFCRQDYADFEIVFGVADAGDPVVPVIERLQRDFPERDIRLIATPPVGVNRKAGLLHVLAHHARHEILIASDSDMRVTPAYLRRVVAPLADEDVGLVTCLYRGKEPLTLTARLEALYMGATFLPSVLVARLVLGMRFAMGATDAFRRRDVEKFGGFAAIADYLADDYQLGLRIADMGLRVHMSDYIVDSVLGATTFREQWDREVRWSQCTRVSRSWEYPGLLLTFSTPLAVLLVVASGLAPVAWFALGMSLLLRWSVAWLVTSYTGDQATRRWLFWLPVRDMLSALVWCAGGVGRRVAWRGTEYVLRSDGRLEPLPDEKRGFAMILEKTVRALDAVLRRQQRIFEFSDDGDCLLRLALSESPSDLTLSDGTRIRRGDPVGEIHLWNEHVLPMPEGGPDLAWARTFRRQIMRSALELAAFVETDPQWQNVVALRGEGTFGRRNGTLQIADLVERWGAEFVRRERPAGPWQRFAHFVDNLYVWILIWVFNRASLKGKNLRKLERGEFWISRSALIEKYGTSALSLISADGDANHEPASAKAGLHDPHQRKPSAVRS